MAGFGTDPDLHVMMNMHWEPLAFDIQEVPGRGWHRAIDTSLVSPADISEPGNETPISGTNYIVTSRSVVVLISKDKQSGAEASSASAADPQASARELSDAIGKTPDNEQRA
jgi:glycogen operon protein